MSLVTILCHTNKRCVAGDYCVIPILNMSLVTILCHTNKRCVAGDYCVIPIPNMSLVTILCHTNKRCVTGDYCVIPMLYMSLVTIPKTKALHYDMQINIIFSRQCHNIHYIYNQNITCMYNSMSCQVRLMSKSFPTFSTFKWSFTWNIMKFCYTYVLKYIIYSKYTIPTVNIKQ